MLLALATVAGGGCASVGRNVPGIRNYAKVEDGLYRGGQPSREGIENLKRQGFRTIINLRDDFNPRERGWVEAVGMNYVLIGSDAHRDQFFKLHPSTAEAIRHRAPKLEC